MRWTYLSALVVVGSTMSGASAADRAPTYYAYVEQSSLALFVAEDSPGTLFSRDLKTGDVRPLYTSKSGALFSIVPSSDGRRIAFLDRTLQYDVPVSAATFEERGRAGIETSILKVIDLLGTELASFNEVRDFDWSSDGNQISFVTGHYVGHYEPFAETATWIADLTRHTAAKVMDGGNRVRWPSFDRNVYVWGTPPRGDDWVARVLMPEQKVEDTSLESIYFSRSGEYYYRPKPGNQAIFRTADQTEVNTPAMSTISSFELLGWSPAQNVLWMRVALRSQPSPLTRTNVLFDLDNDTITNVGRDVVGWAGEGRLLRQSDDGPEVVSIADAAEQAKAQAK